MLSSTMTTAEWTTPSSTASPWPPTTCLSPDTSSTRSGLHRRYFQGVRRPVLVLPKSSHLSCDLFSCGLVLSLSTCHLSPPISQLLLHPLISPSSLQVEQRTEITPLQHTLFGADLFHFFSGCFRRPHLLCD